MKLLLFSDLHTDTGAARRLVERAHAVDVIVGAGDFATVRRHVRDCIDVLRGSRRRPSLWPVIMSLPRN